MMDVGSYEKKRESLSPNKGSTVSNSSSSGNGQIYQNTNRRRYQIRGNKGMNNGGFNAESKQASELLTMNDSNNKLQFALTPDADNRNSV